MTAPEPLLHDDLARLVDVTPAGVTLDDRVAYLALSGAEAVTLAEVLAEAARAVDDPDCVG